MRWPFDHCMIWCSALLWYLLCFCRQHLLTMFECLLAFEVLDLSVFELVCQNLVLFFECPRFPRYINCWNVENWNFQHFNISTFWTLSEIFRSKKRSIIVNQYPKFIGYWYDIDTILIRYWYDIDRINYNDLFDSSLVVGVILYHMRLVEQPWATVDY